MNNYANNAYFWQKVDTLFLSGNLKKIKKKGEVHDTFKNLVFPTDYGRLEDLVSHTGGGIPVYMGSGNRNKITGLIVAADILTKELDVKILVGCNDEETEEVLRYLNQTDFQKTVYITRGAEIPSWGETDN